MPRHIVCKTPDEAAAAFDQLSNGGGVVVKAQVHAGGRGAGQLMGYADKLGGVKFVTSKEKAKTVAEAMLKHALKTKQTGPEGTKVQTLSVQADADTADLHRLAIGERLHAAGRLRPDPRAHDRQRLRRRQHMAMAAAGMVRVAVGDHGPVDAARGVDVEATGLDQEPGRRRPQPAFRMHSRMPSKRP